MGFRVIDVLTDTYQWSDTTDQAIDYIADTLGRPTTDEEEEEFAYAADCIRFPESGQAVYNFPTIGFRVEVHE